MEEYTGRERSPPPDPAENAAAEIPVPNSPTPTGRTFQDTFNSPQMPASPTGGQELTQEALIEVLRNQHQNIVQQQNLIAGQGAQISELTKLVSGLVQMQTDVLKDQAQREADERERKAEEERKAAEEAATSSTPRAGSLFTSAPKKSDSKYSGSSGGKMESYIPNCPQLEIKDSGRRHEINTWLSFRERFGSWLCLLDECYAAELQEAVKQTTTIEQGKLAPEAAVRSSKLYHWMKQAMSGYKRGLDLAVLQEREQGGLTCGYELFRRINNLLGVTTRAEALSLREAVMRLDVNGLKQLGCPSAGSVKNPLDSCVFLTQEFARLRDQCAAFADLQMMEVDQIMVMMRCLPQEIHRHLAFHGKSSTLRELMESLEFYEQQSKALDFSRDSHKGNPVGYDRPPKGSPKGGKDRTPKGEGKGKEIRCRRCGKPGHAEKDCWSKSPKRTDKDKGKRKVENQKVEKIVHIHLTTRRRREIQKVASLKEAKGNPRAEKDRKGRCMSDPPQNPSTGREPQPGAEVRGPSTFEPRRSATRRGDRHPLAFGCESQRPGSSGATYAPTQISRQRHHSAHPYADEIDDAAEITAGGRNLPQIAQVMRGLLTTSLMSTGSTCYLNNTLLAQAWTTLLTTSLELDTWGAWTQPILSMFTTHAGEAHDPCHDSILGRMLAVWFTSHASTAQHDVGEFASWMRAQMFEKKLMPGGFLTIHTWDSRLFTTIEDSDSLLAPIVHRDLPEVPTPLQEAIQQWHHQGPFLNGLRTTNSWVCLQLERHPRLHHRYCQDITWERKSIHLPVFDGYNHCSVTWTEFQIVAGVIHIGSTPVDGHYQAVLFNSGAGLLCDDNSRPIRLTRDLSFYQNIYLLWVAPMTELRTEFRRPIPWPSAATLGTLISEHLG